MKWQLVVEYKPEAAMYTGSVAGLNIKVESTSEGETLRLLKEAIPLHLAMLDEVGQSAIPGSARIIEHEVDSPLLPGERRKPKPGPQPSLGSRLKRR
jgi:hypothetical protein